MMLPYGIDYLIFQDRHTEHLREVERRQLARQTPEGQKRSDRFSSVLLWLGRRLVVWGRHLEERNVARPASQAGSRC